MRRFLAVFAMLALSLAYLSVDAATLAAAAPECCASGLCPMHRMAQQHGASCDTDMSHPASQLQACPSHGQRYAALPDFVRAAPPLLATSEALAEPVAPFVHPFAAPVVREVAAPPPRTTLA
jgi:hypothetical protein